jgi:hypothetical protein
MAQRSGKTGLAACCALIFLVATAAPVSALGDPRLDYEIITSPVPGWEPASAAKVRPLVTSLARVETAAASGYGGSAAVAGQGWDDPTQPKSSVLIALIGVSASGASASTLDQQVGRGAAVAADTFCEGATARPPVSETVVLSIPGSHHVQCGTAPNGSTLSAVTFGKANVLAIIFTTSLSVDSLDAIAHRQYLGLPAFDSSVRSGSGGGTGLVVGIVVAVVAAALLGLVVAIRARKRKVQQPEQYPVGVVWPTSGAGPFGRPDPSLPPAGMYPDPSGTGRTRYWTGREWGPEDPGPPRHIEDTSRPAF